MKRLIAILISLLLFTGCAAQGVSTEEYNAIVAERDALRLELDGTKNTAITSQMQSTPTKEPEATPTATAPQTDMPTQQPELTFESSFEFDDWSVTVGDEIIWSVVKNQFSDFNGMEVFGVRLSAVNNIAESRSPSSYYAEIYDPNGAELDRVDKYFDNSIFDAKVRSGATAEGYLYILYTGDGDYFIEFNDRTSFFEVKLPIAK